MGAVFGKAKTAKKLVVKGGKQPTRAGVLRNAH